MGQAKTLTQAEIDQVLAYIATRSFAQRNRVILLTGLLTSMRVGEIASLKVGDVMHEDGTIKNEMRLTAEVTKGRKPRTVFVSDKLQTELQRYVDARRVTDLTQPLFVTAGRKAFTAAVLTQNLYWLFKNAGISGASSHSMRRTCITNLANKGVGVRVIMGISGHLALSSVQLYIDCNDDMKRNAVNLL
jgi:integrase/recombinase XerD